MLAVGFDKVRNDHCTLIFDANQAGTTQSAPATLPTASTGSGASSDASVSGIETVTKALLKLSINEAVTAMDWLTAYPSTLVVGTGLKWLRLYDVRGSMGASAAAQPLSVMAHTKAVQAVCVDPCNGNRLATCSDEGTSE